MWNYYKFERGERRKRKLIFNIKKIVELNKFELMLKLKQTYQNFRHVCIHIFNNSWKFLKYYFKLRLYSIIILMCNHCNL